MARDTTFEALPIGEEKIRERVRQLGAEVLRDSGADSSGARIAELTVVPVLTGAFVLAADLVRSLCDPDGDSPLRLSVRVEWLKAVSYRGDTTPGEITLDVSFLEKASITGKHVLLVDDIVDSGRTLLEALRTLQDFRPASLRSLVLLDKPERRHPDLTTITPDYVGFRIPNAFVVGYGLDYDGLFRDLPYVTTLDSTGRRPTPVEDR